MLCLRLEILLIIILSSACSHQRLTVSLIYVEPLCFNGKVSQIPKIWSEASTRLDLPSSRHCCTNKHEKTIISDHHLVKNSMQKELFCCPENFNFPIKYSPQPNDLDSALLRIFVVTSA
jgi:hypothetical protein